ncbi:hypothetical protein Q5752_003641 [Cryptotrichosporon argae]
MTSGLAALLVMAPRGPEMLDAAYAAHEAAEAEREAHTHGGARRPRRANLLPTYVPYVFDWAAKTERAVALAEPHDHNHTQAPTDARADARAHAAHAWRPRPDALGCLPPYVPYSFGDGETDVPLIAGVRRMLRAGVGLYEVRLWRAHPELAHCAIDDSSSSSPDDGEDDDDHSADRYSIVGEPDEDLTPVAIGRGRAHARIPFTRTYLGRVVPRSARPPLDAYIRSARPAGPGPMPMCDAPDGAALALVLADRMRRLADAHARRRDYVRGAAILAHIGRNVPFALRRHVEIGDGEGALLPRADLKRRNAIRRKEGEGRKRVRPA